ncbi:hypothetical protein DXG01_015644 [Tephrocybe rancida]|nr:hypothetical protein DXG01_015644 [Tephrocybe rancida]
MAQPAGSTPQIGEYIHVLTARTQVLDTIREWLTLGGGAQDTFGLRDSQLYTALVAFLAFLESLTDHALYDSKNFNEEQVQASVRRLEDARSSSQRGF